MNVRKSSMKYQKKKKRRNDQITLSLLQKAIDPSHQAITVKQRMRLILAFSTSVLNVTVFYSYFFLPY